MPNWRGFVVSATNSGDLRFWLPSLVLVASSALITAFARWRSPTHLDQSYAIATLLPLLVSPHVHTQNRVLLTLPGAILLRAYFEAGRSAEREMRAANVMLLTYTAAFALPLLAIQGLSLTIFPMLAAYALMLTRWPKRAAAAPALQLTPVDMPARAA